MGTDNLFHKRKAKGRAELSRKGKGKSVSEKILIVCEGGKTEPNYLKEMKKHYKLETASVIEVCGDECGSDPRSVFNYAKKKRDEEMAKCAPYDKIFCVIDKDTHENYVETMDSISRVRPSGLFVAINSVPCFEYWLLLHFEYTTKAYGSLPKKSSGNLALKDLKKYIPDYDKGCHGIFVKLENRLNRAIENSKRALGAASENKTDNPSSRMHVLIEKLQEIKAIIDDRKS